MVWGWDIYWGNVVHTIFLVNNPSPHHFPNGYPILLLRIPDVSTLIIPLLIILYCLSKLKCCYLSSFIKPFIVFKVSNVTSYSMQPVNIVDG